MKQKRSTALLLLIGFGCLAIYLWLRSEKSTDLLPKEIVVRIPDLKRQVEEEQKRATKAVADYRPKTPGRIDDLATPAAELLRQLPGVVEVEATTPSKPATHRLIHLRDWHFVPKDLYALDMATAYKRPLTQQEIDLLHEELLLEVELVQIEQMAVLRCLIEHHGLRRVVAEGFSDGEVKLYKEKVAAHGAVEKEQIPALRKQLAEIRTLLADMKEGEERYGTAKKIEEEILGLLDQHRIALLELGAAGRLLMTGELQEVLPLEDAEKLEQAKPVTPSGEVKLDPAKVKARNDAQVRMAFKHGPVAVVILGGAHDLKDSASRFTGGCEYLRVTTRRFKELSGR